MSTGSIRRIFSPIVELRDDEGVTALLMFAYAYLGMTSYNIIQPLTRSKLIDSLGAVNVPYVIFANGLLIGVLMPTASTTHGRRNDCSVSSGAGLPSAA